MSTSDLYSLAKEQPKLIATALFVILCIGAIGAGIYIFINEERASLGGQHVSLLEEKINELESDFKKQKKINKVIIEEVAVLRSGFKGLPSTMERVKGAFSELSSETQLATGKMDKIDGVVIALAKNIDQVKSSLEKSEALSKTFDVFLSATEAENNNDYGAAVKLYRVAANQGNPNAQFRLGTLYAQGKGVAKDFVEATALYQSAAFSGVEGAQVELATAYLEGFGVEADNVRGAAWLELLTDSAPLSIERKLLSVKSEMTEEQKRKVIELTEELRKEVEENPNKQIQSTPKTRD
jgi:hypothetical protein